MPTRRELMQIGGVAGVAALTGLSGCLGANGAEYEDWLVDPFYLPDRPERYQLFTAAPAEFDDYAAAFGRDEWADLEDELVGQYDFTRLFPDEVDRVTQGAGGYRNGGFDVVTGDFDEEFIEDDIAQTELRPFGAYEDFELYEDPDDSRWAIGIADGTFVISAGTPQDEAVRVVEDIIDAREGDVERYAEVDPDFDVLMDAVSLDDFLIAWTFEPRDESAPERGVFRNQVGFALGADLDEDDTDVELTVAYLDERDPVERDLEDWSREDDSLRMLRDVEIDIDDEVAQLEGEVRTRSLLDFI